MCCVVDQKKYVLFCFFFNKRKKQSTALDFLQLRIMQTQAAVLIVSVLSDVLPLSLCEHEKSNTALERLSAVTGRGRKKNPKLSIFQNRIGLDINFIIDKSSVFMESYIKERLSSATFYL